MLCVKGICLGSLICARNISPHFYFVMIFSSCQFFFFKTVNQSFLHDIWASRIFRKQLPIFMVSFPESSKDLPVPFLCSSSYKEGRRGYFPSVLQEGDPGRIEMSASAVPGAGVQVELEHLMLVTHQDTSQ